MMIAVAFERGLIRSERSWRGRAKLDCVVLVNDENLLSLSLWTSPDGEAAPVSSRKIWLSDLLREAILVPASVSKRLM